MPPLQPGWKAFGHRGGGPAKDHVEPAYLLGCETFLRKSKTTCALGLGFTSTPNRQFKAAGLLRYARKDGLLLFSTQFGSSQRRVREGRIMTTAPLLAKEPCRKRKHYIHRDKRSYNVRKQAYDIPYAHALQ